MNNHKIAATVILYNPETIGVDQVYKNIMSYSNTLYTEHRGGVYIIDNSPIYSKKREDKFLTIPGAFYYHNKNIGGIAGAQNYACKKALEDGFEWIMTMDQDSIFDEKIFRDYLNLFFKWKSTDTQAKSFTLRMIRADENILSFEEIVRFKILSPIKRKLIRQDPKTIHKAGSNFWDGEDITYPTIFVPASANIINLETWKELGGFDETLFFDQVDNDFSIRLTNSGYKIVKFNTITFSHYIGEKKFTIFYKHTPHYNSSRLYYIFRNHLIMKSKYHQYKLTYKNLLKWYFIEYCIFNWYAIKNLIIFLIAYKDYKKILHSQNFFRDSKKQWN